ncbi:Nuclear transcription factor Y subunit B-9 [Striga hermonthica]|uniref:Nuclear transcription factor Y subunit B-9 n=1 Tax=Striga hermonthica TaxID=68872 RepID=A0A9N7R7K6_STRHE|nr:Nuclear transcription factor Y subunit B-9 [Striga hermonthica]
MRRTLPANAKISDEAKVIVQECLSEFISFVTNEANERCHRECRKTISSEDLLSAMGSLGFDAYVEPLAAYIDRYRAQNLERGHAYRRGPYTGHGLHRPTESTPSTPLLGPPPPQMGGGKSSLAGEFDPFWGDV